MLKCNETTLESHEDEKEISYDLGSTLANIQSILGKKWIFWLLPIPSTTGDGFTFPGIKLSPISEE